MASLKSFLDQYEAELTTQRAPQPAVDLSRFNEAAVAPKPAKDAGGFAAAAKRAVGGAIQGTGQLAADFLPGFDQGNALQRYGKSVVDANAPAITSLEGIAERPGMALKEASGNVAGSVGTAVGLRALGQGITAASPLAGPVAPLVAAVGQGVSWGSPILAGLLPSFGGIRERQIEKDPNAAGSAGDKLKALGGATAVGAIEKFGPEGWAVAALNRDARKALVGKFTAPTTLGRMGMAGGKGALVEGATEMIQNPIEQAAAGDNPLDPAALKGTLFAGAMGAIGGGTVGSVFGAIRDKPANAVSDDDLKGGIDEQLAPPAPVEDTTMQAEWDVMQRAAALQNDQRARAASVPAPFADQAHANDAEIRRQMDAEGRDPLDLTGEAPQADPLVDVATPELTRMLGLVEQGIVSGQPMPGAENVMQRIRDVLATREEAPGADTRTLPLFDADGRLSPEATIAERAARAGAPDMTADEVAARLQDAAAPAADGQAALMAGQMPAPSPIEIAQGGTPVAAVPAASLKGLPKGAQSELSRYATDPQQMAAAVADMFYTKAEAGSSAAYVFDKLPALYQQLTGQPLPETRQAATPLQRTALPFELQGETNEQAAANYAQAQEMAAAETPLPNVDVSPKQAGFLTPDGEVDTVQPGLSRRESARQTAARAFAARQQKARQADRAEIAAMLGENIPAAPEQTQETQDDAAPDVVGLGGEGMRGDAGTGTGAGGDRAVGTPGRTRRGARALAASDAQPVAVGSGTGERAAGVAETQEASPFAAPEKRDLELAGYKKAYLELRKPADMPMSTFAKKQAEYLQSIAEMERNADSTASKKGAKKFLEEQAKFAPAAVKMARRKAADATKWVEHIKDKLDERNKSIAEKEAAWEQMLSEMDDTTSRKASRTDKQLEKGFKGKASGTATAPANPNVHTPRSLAEALVEKFGEDMRDAILAGRVQIVADQTHLAAMTGDASRRGKLTQGMYYWNPSKPAGNGTVYFVAANLARTQQGYTAFDVALHEIGEHAGMEQMLGKQNYQQLLSSIRKAMTATAPKTQFERDVAKAMKKLLVDQQGQPHEVLAYMIQHTPDSTGLQKMWAAIKAFAARFGLLPDSMKDAATMRTLAAGATAKWLNKVAATREMSETNRGGVGQASGQDRWGMTRAALQQVEDGRLTLDGEYGFDTMTRLLDEARALQTDYPDSTVVELYKDLGGTGVVYGAGGYNRYGLRADGQLAPIESSFSNKEKLAAAKAAIAQAQNMTGAASGIADPETRKIFTNFSDATAAAKSALTSVEALKAQDWLGKTIGAFTDGLSWLTKHHLTALFDKSLNGGLALNVKADTIQEATSARLNQMFNEPYHQFEALERAAPERAKMLGQLMQATEFQMDPRKSWEQHTHLHSLAGDQLSLAKKYLNEYRQMWGKLTPTERKLYNDLATMNEAMYTAELAVVTYNMVRANPGAQQLDAFKADPTEKFRQSKAVHDSIENAQTYWRGVLDTYVAAIDKHVADQRGVLPKRGETDPEYQAEVNRMLKDVRDEKVRNRIRAQLRTHSNKLSDDDRKIVRHLTPLEAQLRTVSDTVETFKHAPYFHLGRFGDDFVSFRVRNDGVTADPAAMSHVQRVLADKFPKITIRTDATDPHVFARFENVTEAQAFEQELFKLQEQGWLMQEGVKDQGNKDLGKIVRGTRATVIENHAGPQWLEMVVESIQAEGYDPEIEAQMVAHVRSLYIDSLPDSAAIKVKLRREGRPGWHSDMLRNYAHRMRVGSNRVASLASEPTRTQSFSVMKDALARAGEDKTVDRAELKKRHAVVEEFKKRHNDQMTVPQTPGIDMLRAVNHAYFLGMSPSYVLIQMTQLGVLTWPELAKKHGFVKSAKVIAEVSGTAFKIMSAVIAEGYKARGVKGAADMVITGEMLEKAGVSASDAEFLTSVMASGKLDIGNASRELGRVAEGAAEGKWGRRGTEALRVASAFGYASETLTRTITALAAKRLHKGPGAVEYAIGVIDESMLNYNSNNIGRMTGKQGVVGKPTQIMFSFLQYQFQLLEKLYREFYSAFAKGATPEQRAEARKFLGGHMMAMMALAGSLGLPFATAIAAAADKLCEVFGDGHCDSKTALRNVTSDVFGHDIEPLISRGLLTRALGTDISDRAGEANILPFSKFLADKRAMDERFMDLATASWGAPSAMVVNMFKGYEKIAQGDLLGGMQEAVPLALKGPIKAYTMSEKGYTDNAGNVLPMEAGAYDMLLQTLGLNPGEKADYQQAKFAQSQRTGVLGREATQIRQKLATAIEQGDQGDIQKWSERAQEFDTTNPSHAILPRMASVLQQRARSRAQAEATGTTLGVSLKDIEGQQFARFLQP